MLAALGTLLSASALCDTQQTAPSTAQAQQPATSPS